MSSHTYVHLDEPITTRHIDAPGTRHVSIDIGTSVVLLGVTPQQFRDLADALTDAADQLAKGQAADAHADSNTEPFGDVVLEQCS